MIEEYRRTGGTLSGGMLDGSVLVLLTTMGRRTGQPHTAPMMFKELEGGRLLVIASANGAASDPAWYRNLQSNPRVTVERASDRFEATATTATGDERARLWADLIESHPFFVDHQAGIEREIPLVILERQ